MSERRSTELSAKTLIEMYVAAGQMQSLARTQRSRVRQPAW